MKKKIIIKGPALSRSGYGEHTRFIIDALRQQEDKLYFYLINIRWGNTGWVSQDSEDREWIDNRIRKTVHYIEEC